MSYIEVLKKNFNNNNIKLHFFEKEDELYSYISKKLGDDKLIGVGDSMTLEELGLYDYLRKANVTFLDKYDATLSKQDKKNLYLRNFSSDIFFSSANAISYEGKIYNLDGNGSRVAPIIYGPKKVFIICGINKLVKNEEEAFKRIKEVAAPLDAIRLNKKTPCTVTKSCVNCKSKDKICNYMTIIGGQFDSERIELLVINKKLGY